VRLRHATAIRFDAVGLSIRRPAPSRRQRGWPNRSGVRLADRLLVGSLAVAHANGRSHDRPDASPDPEAHTKTGPEADAAAQRPPGDRREQL
jgi:hypothetical protein